MSKTYHFMAGLPRAGSTLLKSLLNQNPNIHTEPVSPILELMYYTDQYFTTSEQYLAFPKPKSAYKLISNVIDNYYFDTEEPVVIDHCRAWVNNIERIKTYITPNPKIICPVRDVANILTSFITLIHRNGDEVSFIDQHLKEHNCHIDDDNRCRFLMGPDGIVHQALWAQSQAFRRGDHKKHMLFVEYEDLMSSPQQTMDRIYEFLEMDSFRHDFDRIDNPVRESDHQWNLNNMHHVRRKLEKKSRQPEDVLSEEILNNYKNLEYWKYSNHRYF
jgi:sulfotransferase